MNGQTWRDMGIAEPGVHKDSRRAASHLRVGREDESHHKTGHSRHHAWIEIRLPQEDDSDDRSTT